ncbi:MAG: hypothetical protein COU81_01420 [Candidatus Portnoybacteria bacterium CG10_big_fil_rev_8_21_14_0_10_36_7]|uniref:O-antigen ligase-related domain-containing protein n=1 Tax=Candidatus Portnoybacteria bacterium CG10_big_fil_rev_8_21_14_0_10_36_7 TaxID=1974812 RepID=A0A2M8KEF7_9BACT|nr:MAG: hypothetical protein COU81_01420 [Candidatus Portnoybacteria bacterium CG10_big_fil_rev_8_21_14_0_10_36_7]
MLRKNQIAKRESHTDFMFNIFLVIFLLATFCLAIKKEYWAVVLIPLFLPLYFLRLTIINIPTTALELVIYFIFAGWLVGRYRANNIKSIVWFEIFFWPIIIILLGVMLSIIVSKDTRVGLGILKGWFIDPLVVYLLIINIVKLKGQVSKIYIAWFVSGVVVSVIALFYLLTGYLTFDGRLSAYYSSPNQLGMYLVPALLAGFVLLNRNLFKYNKILSCGIVGGFLAIVISLYYTFSYGAWLGLLFGLWGFLWYQFKEHRNKIIVILVVVALLILGTQLVSEKMQNLMKYSRSSLESRLIIYRSALKIGQDHWLLGIGPGMFQRSYLEYQKLYPPYLEWSSPQPHNIFLAFWLQSGLVGLVGFVWLLRLFINGVVAYIKKNQYRKLVLINLSIMIYFLVHGMTDTTYWNNDLAIMFWIIIALNYTVAHLGD